MSWEDDFYNDPYHTPGKFGLEIVKEIDESGGYEFSTTVIWKDGEGNFYWAFDAGCSCPTPFEGYRSIDDLEVLTLETFDKFFDATVSNHQYDFYDRKADLNREILDVRELLNGS
jgi:hypothetical protein